MELRASSAQEQKMIPGDRRVVLCSGREKEYGGPQHFIDSKGGNNYIVTSSYTWYNFVPKNLLEQFMNLANVYFLLVGILQIIPQLSTTNGVPTQYYPLAFIICVSGLRAGTEDYRRHQSDAERNGTLYKVLSKGKFVDKSSGDLRVGDIVKILKDQTIPADVLLMGSSNPKGNCFIDKSNLNGETTLEVLSSIKSTVEACNNGAEGIEQLVIELTYERPNHKFDSFRGHLTVRYNNGAQSQEHMTGKYLLMRETNLRNSDFVYGLVVYNGDDTKIQMSNNEGPKPGIKTSSIMKRVNMLLIAMLSFQSFMCLIAGVAGAFWQYDHQTSWFLDLDLGRDEAIIKGFYTFFSFFILLSQMVPISLIVSAEMVKFAQSSFLIWDIHLYSDKIDKPARVNNSTIHEDLGLIDYIISDKTGTLTQNKMEFRYALLSNGAEYGSQNTQIAKAVASRQRALEMKLSGNEETVERVRWADLNDNLIAKADEPDNEDCFRTGFCSCLFDMMWNTPSEVLNNDNNGVEFIPNIFTEEERETVRADLKSEDAKDSKSDLLKIFATHMALSNTVKPYEDEGSEGELKFQCDSAEEQAMVLWAQSVGYTKISSGPTVLKIDGPTGTPTYQNYTLLATFGFSSKRARVTVIYQNDWDKKIHVMSKGQDSVMLPLIKDFPGKKKLKEDLLKMNANGLRTLVCTYAILDEEWWTARAASYQSAILIEESDNTVGCSEGKCNPAKCEKCIRFNCFETIEKEADMSYLGVMALEDQLQDIVEETINDFIKGGIRVWMITGDKLETAKNIGIACNLIDPDMEVASNKKFDSIEDLVQASNDSRLIEVTGAWANVTDDHIEMKKLFKSVDINDSSSINLEEFHNYAEALGCGLSHDEVEAMFKEADTNDNKELNYEEFLSLMKSTEITPHRAVRADIESGIARYVSIQDHDTYPVSMLVNRSAFEVLFPANTKKRRAAARKNSDVNVSDEDLEALRKKFFFLASVSKSVIFARAQPAMKKRMVTEIQKRDPKAITLAIGDGANDVDMITAAHIGVGISGIEGTAASNGADYAISTFRMLHTLLFVHGFWNYHRVSNLVKIIFYKASLVAITQFFYGFYSGFSGQQFFNDPIYQLYNVVFTAIPVLVVAIMDQALPRKVLENNPIAYRESKHRSFSGPVFAGWILRGFVHSGILLFVPLFSIGDAILPSTGHTVGIWYLSTTTYTAIVLTASTLICFDFIRINVMHVISLVGSLISFIVMALFLANVQTLNPNLFGVTMKLWTNPLYFLAVALALSGPLLLELLIKGIRRELRPTATMIYEERQHSMFLSLPDDVRQEIESGDYAPKTNANSSMFGNIKDKFESLSPTARSRRNSSNAIQKILRFRSKTIGTDYVRFSEM